MRAPDLLGLATGVVPRRPPPAFDPARLRSVLIVRMSAIGDVVHALPVASALRRRYPRLRISWAVEDWTAPLLERHPAVDRVVVFPRLAAASFTAAPSRWSRALRRAVAVLREETYDVALDLQGLLKTSLVALLSRAPLRLGLDGQREGAHLFSCTIPLPRGRLHAVEEGLRAAELLGAPGEPVSFDLRADPAAIASVSRQLRESGVPPRSALIVIQPSSSAERKNWPAESWARVADALGDCGEVVLVGGREHTARHAQIARACGRVRDFTGRTNLAELVALLERATLHLAPDTGSAHIAAALGRPVVGVYGPSSISRLGPYRQIDRTVAHQDLCGFTCPALCRRPRCLAAIRPEEVIEKAREALRAPE